MARFPWHEHPPWTDVLVHPCAHGLIQATHPTWCELLNHIFIPFLQHVLDLPEVIPEGWWVTCCHGKHLQDHFKSLVQPECMQMHWCSMKQSISPSNQNLECSGPLMVPMRNYRPSQHRNSPYVMGHCLLAFECQHLPGTIIPTINSLTTHFK